MKSQLIKCVSRYFRVLLVATCMCTGGVASAAMNADSDLDFTAATSGGIVEPTSGSWFSMVALDLDVDGVSETSVYTPISSFDGIKLDVLQTPSGSHSGSPDGSESPTIDNPWVFFTNTGMHGTTVTPITVATDDLAGNVTFVMSGWTVDWNGGLIDMGGGANAVVSCAATCEYGDTYTLDYNAIVPSGGFAGVAYAVHLEGTIAQRPATNTAPVANDDAATVDRKATGRTYTPSVIDVVVNDTDVDGNNDIDRSTVTIVTDVVNGLTSVDPVTGNVTYTPSDDYLGPDSFTYTVSDFGGPEGPINVLVSNIATVNITVQNAIPVAVDDSATVDTATAPSADIDVTANDTDSDGIIDVTSVAIVTIANDGTTSVAPVTGVVTYTPTADFIGLDSFTYTVNDNDGVTSNTATVNITVTDSTVSGVLDPDAFLIMVTGQVIDGLTEPPLGNGSWFSMEVEPGKPLHTAIAGFNHLHLGTTQLASSVPLLPDIDQGWQFFGNIGVHQTTSTVTIITDDTAGNVTLNFSGWDVSWNGIASIPLGSGQDNGVATLTCYTDLALLAQGDCSEGDQFVLDYRAIVPEGDPSGFGGVNYRLHMEGVISLTGSQVGGGDPNAPFDVDVASAVDANGVVLPIDPGTKAAAAGNTTGFGLTAAEIGVNDPLMNPNDGAQCIGGCADFVITSVTTDYIDIVYKLNVPVPNDSTQLRKLRNSIWGDFDTSTGDLIGSAATDVNGNCQGPAGVFSIGLRAGNACVYLRLNDGGLNDIDGLKDGKVTDPSGVLLAGTPNVPPGSTSGCSITSNPVELRNRADWLVVLGFFMLLAVIRYRRSGG